MTLGHVILGIDEAALEQSRVARARARAAVRAVGAVLPAGLCRSPASGSSPAAGAATATTGSSARLMTGPEAGGTCPHSAPVERPMNTASPSSRSLQRSCLPACGRRGRARRRVLATSRVEPAVATSDASKIVVTRVLLVPVSALLQVREAVRGLVKGPRPGREGRARGGFDRPRPLGRRPRSAFYALTALQKRAGDRRRLLRRNPSRAQAARGRGLDRRLGGRRRASTARRS